ncbi:MULTISPECIES: hypothetical protein [unclassified Streptomyces]|uniref:hypothetical protein n=1 Tax=unclassified Streptomyces TaxID=2593676 RepID=UPI001BEBC15D|nr:MULTISPECIES: hypothetical protein [unclassified Streptomyces]MBT2405320.1 hypothetical protein [Streptomyces sp. ISL-21]MBT2613272.1 hypothetical protein [Streptomyces sp. ISL-87]
MKLALSEMFDKAEARERGLAAGEIAYTIMNTPPGSENRAEILAMVNGGKASTPEGRAALRSLMEPEPASDAQEISKSDGPSLEERRAETRSFADKLGSAALPSSQVEERAQPL